MPTRIGMPIERLAHGYVEKVASPIYSAATGIAMYAIKQKRTSSVGINSSKEKIDMLPKLFARITLPATRSTTKGK